MFMSDFDQRQYRLMLKSLDDYSAGRARIDALITNLEGLLNALRAVEPEWRQTFLHYWGQIEDERADALFRNLDSLDDHAAQVVTDAVSHLKLMVLEKTHDPIEVQESVKDSDG